MKFKKNTRILLALVTGFIAAMAIMAIAIYFGYTKAYATDAASLPVSIAGIPIYQLTLSGAEYIGEAKGVFMGVSCGVCMLLSVAVGELIARVRKR